MTSRASAHSAGWCVSHCQNHSKSLLERFNFCHTYKQKRPSGVPGASLERYLRNIDMLHFPQKYSIFRPEVRQQPPKAPQKSPKPPQGPLWGSKVKRDDGPRATPRAPATPPATPRRPPLADDGSPGPSLGAAWAAKCAPKAPSEPPRDPQGPPVSPQACPIAGNTIKTNGFSMISRAAWNA